MMRPGLYILTGVPVCVNSGVCDMIIGELLLWAEP